jgi:hypothetical protein
VNSYQFGQVIGNTLWIAVPGLLIGFRSHHPGPAGKPTAKRALQEVDHCSGGSAQEGLVTLTDLIFPDPGSTSVSLYAIGGTATAASLKLNLTGLTG